MRGLAKSVPTVARAGRVALAAVLLCAVTGVAEAQGGFFELFGNAFGGGGDVRAFPEPDDAIGDRPLTVRRHPRPHRPRSAASRGGSQHYDVAALKGVTIYTDKTLERGDAVMTTTGLKVFNGSQSWPYKEADFVAIAASGKSTDFRKELTAIDDASKPAFAR